MVPEGDIGGGSRLYPEAPQRPGGPILSSRFILFTSGTDSRQAMRADDYTQCPGNVVVARDERFAKTEYRYAGRPLPGMFFPRGRKPCCICRKKTAFLKWYARWWRLRLPSITWQSSFHSEFRHQTLSPQELFQRLVSIGVTQHYAIVDGDWTKELEELARLMGFDFYKI